MQTLREFQFDGEAALEALLVQSKYGSIEQAVACLTLFTHPDTIAQIENKALFRVRRYRGKEERGEIVHIERVVLCDNDSPTRAFLWANDLGRGHLAEVQYNHIYQMAYDPAFYTSLANICVTPAFLSKLTDKNPRVIQLLKYRASQAYGFVPDGEPRPEKPEGYDKVIWADFLPACPDLKSRIVARLRNNVESRIALSIEHFGWHYGPKF